VADTAGTTKKPEPPKPIRWNVYKLASKAVWLGAIEAPDEAAAMEKAAAEFQGAGEQADGAAGRPAVRVKSRSGAGLAPAMCFSLLADARRCTARPVALKAGVERSRCVQCWAWARESVTRY
jgi:hypothetical protein